jgi:undecaprenyl-diphosphatase
LDSFNLPSQEGFLYGALQPSYGMHSMDLPSSIFLGVVQGLTEFLPISSSGHLVLFQNLLGYREPALLFDVGLHVGTLAAVCLYFRTDLKNMATESWTFASQLRHGRKTAKDLEHNAYASLTLWVVIGTLPTGLIGLFFRAPLERLFASLTAVGVMLLCTGTLLAAAKFIPVQYNRRRRVGLFAALAVGAAQGLAIAPGLSRSGATIVCGMFFKLERDLAARFSFLLSLPAILGAMIIQLSNLDGTRINLLSWFLGFLTSALVGLVALKVLMTMIHKGKLFYFAPYCWALGLLVFWL